MVLKFTRETEKVVVLMLKNARQRHKKRHKWRDRVKGAREK